MSSYADVQNLVTLLSNGQADLSLFPGFYADVVNVLGAQDWHTTATPITFTEQTSTVNLPSTLLNLHQVIYDDTVLSRLELRDLEALNHGWRNVVGSPVGFTLQAEATKTIEVYPTPFTTSPPIIPVHGLPIGEDYAPGNGIAIYTESRANVLPYLTIPVALKCLAREYVRESDHTDYAFGLLCNQLGDMLLGMLR